MAKNTPIKTPKTKLVSMRITLSNDHFEALQSLSETLPVSIAKLGGYAVGKGLPELQKRFAIDGETN